MTQKTIFYVKMLFDQYFVLHIYKICNVYKYAYVNVQYL